MKSPIKIRLGPSWIAAFIASWAVNESVLWGILHALIAPFYLVYWILHYTDAIEFIKTVIMRG